MFAALAHWTLRNRLFAAVLLAAVVGAALAGLPDLRADLNARNFFATDDPELERLDAHLAYWGKDDNQLLVLVSADSGALLTRPRLRRMAWAAHALDSLASVLRVQGLADMPGFNESEGFVPRLPRIADSAPPGQGRAHRGWTWRLTHNSPYVPLLLSADGEVSALLVSLDPELGDTETIAVVAAIEQRLRSFQGFEGLRYELAGVPAMRAAIFELMLGDQMRFMPLGLGMILLALSLLFRRLHGVLIPFLTAAVPMLMLAGVMGWTGEPISVLNQIYFTLLPVITVADAIHLVSRYHEELRKRCLPGSRPDSLARRDAIVEALRHIGPACGLTGFTTVVGFLSLNVASMQNLRSFGNYAALGMCFAYLNTLLLAPLLLSLARSTPPPGGQPDDLTVFDRGLLRCARVSLGRPALVLGATTLLLAGALFFSAQVEVDSDLVSMVQPEHPVWQANHTLTERLGGILNLDVEVRGEPGCLHAPEVLAALLQLEAWALEQPLVRSSQSPASLLAGLNQLSHGQPSLPRTARAAEGAFARLRDRSGLEDLLSADAARGRIILRTQDRGAVAFQAFVAQLQSELTRRLAGLPLRYHVTSTALLGYRGISHLTLDLRNSLLLVFLSVALVIGVLFKNLRVALLCFLPNALPLVVGYGLLGMMGWWLQPAPAVMFTVALAIAVDDTIHLMARVREELRRGLVLRDAVREALLHCGRAVVTTSIILVGGMSISLLSGFPSIVVMAALGMTVIAVAMLCDLFLLPSLLMLFPLPGLRAGTTSLATIGAEVGSQSP